MDLLANVIPESVSHTSPWVGLMFLCGIATKVYQRVDITFEKSGDRRSKWTLSLKK